MQKESVWNYICLFWTIISLLPLCYSAELVIEIPGNSVQEGSTYLLDYSPPYGKPLPNTTFKAADVRDNNIKFQGLPGTKYNFRLYFSNETFHDILTWNETIVTAPHPPTNLSVQVRNGKHATITWSPPSEGQYTSFRFKVIPLNDPSHGGGQPKNFTVDGGKLYYDLKELYPGASYQIQAFTVYDDKESAAYTSRNFTTRPNTPGKFIVWFRNETTLLVLWQPPYPAGAYSHYKVSIYPPDARDSELFVEKEGEPPGPAQAAFKGLIPGRAYNISVQTISEEEISTPTTAQYRTVPLRPLNVTIDKDSVTSSSFRVLWEPPKEKSEFDKYQITVSTTKRFTPVVRGRSEPTSLYISEDMEPGKTYSVTVKTSSGKVTSWPGATDVTLKPLPVEQLAWFINGTTGVVIVSWRPANSSIQDSYKVSYHEVGPSREDSSTHIVHDTEIKLDTLLPGRNYSIIVQAVSNKIESNETMSYVATRPQEPIIRELKSLHDGFNITWNSDVNSKQDQYVLVYKGLKDGVKHEIETRETWRVVSGLFPGALYSVHVAAVSHGLYSDVHPRTAAVLPLPPTSMWIETVSSNSVRLHWSGPDMSRTYFTHYVIRYKTRDDKWVRLPSVAPNHTEADITDMTHGEQYSIQLDTASENVESGKPQEGVHKVKPNPVSNVATLIDSSNITLEWPRPEGRVEIYTVSWFISEQDTKDIVKHQHNVSGNTDGPVRVSVDKLVPGTHYHFQVETVSYGLYGETFQMDARTKPLIQSEISIVNESNHPAGDTLTVLYTVTPRSASRFDTYRFALSSAQDTKPVVIEKLANDTVKQVVFNKLIPGNFYNITMWTVSSNVTSQPIQRQTRLYPKPITELNATKITDTQITLEWDKPQGIYTDFEIFYLVEENVLSQRNTTEHTIDITELRPYKNYTFTVEVRSGTETTFLTKSKGISASFQTKEGRPGRVIDFQPIDSKPSEITFSWSLPLNEHNGILTGFVLEYGLEGSEKTNIKKFSANATQGTIKSLVPGNTYVFRIHAETATGSGPETESVQNMTIAAPPKPHNTPHEIGRTSTTIQVEFAKDYFSARNGNITLFTLIVAEDISNNSSDRHLPSWRDIQDYVVWPPYQVMEPYFPFLTSSLEEFTIGSAQCEAKRSGYCNGPLKPGTKYYVKLRAFTAPDKFTDTDYTLMMTDVDNTAIIVGVTVPMIVILAAVGAGVYIRSRRSGKAARDARLDCLALPDSAALSRPVRVSEFPEHYRLMSADSDFRFSEEFEELKHVGREQPCTAADLPCNRPKNRFTNILPYDHSRFKLQPVDDEEGSDYINANYVPGYNSPREFIVTQGPLHSTRDDFWRMVWESNTRAIVMLTRCFEKGREKCDHYWPYDTRPVYYGDICVTILNDSHYTDWSVTEFMLCRGDQQRVVKHFHFTTWPDFGVPSPPTTLARFVRAFRERCPHDQRPIVVHCSAGVGRSGTFITLDRLLQQLANGAETVDIFSMVRAMRRERVWMVQTEQQYICIHQCLLAVLEGHDAQPIHQIHHNHAYEDDEGIAESGM